MQIDNCLFANNGDGVAVVSEPLGKTITHITNCSFVNNRKIPVSKSWYSTYNGVTDYNKCYISNCIFWEPETIIFYMFFNNDFNNITIYDYHIDYSVLSISSIIGVPGYFEALGSHIKWETYPEFVDTTNYDFRLKPCSPAVNVGNNFIVDSLGLFTDLGGLPRMRFGKVDAGAFESQDSCLEVNLAQPLSVSNTLSVAPNPSTGILHLDLGQQITGDLCLEIYDEMGILAYQDLRCNTLSPTLDLSNLPPGLYLIKASGLHGHVCYTAKWLRMN
ncbi:MAG: T9SS type A sorting domain-containing protein [Bacteroidota bacterium]